MSRSFVRCLRLISCLPVALTAFAQAAPVCIPLAGFVRLDPDPSCLIATKYPGNAYIGAPGTCFSVRVLGPFGFPIGAGSSGLTLEGHISPLFPSAGVTPAILKESGLPSFIDEFGLPETRRFFTARSAIDLFGGRLFSADAGVIGPGGATEQLQITRGAGPWVGATGAIYPHGNIIGNWGPFNGQVCKP
jgi:hypothetical protein